MLIKAIKMHGQGNDYIYFDIMELDVSSVNWNEVAIKWSNRHFGIGSDGIVLIDSDKKYDAMMRMFNIDGSESEMCGTALRCCGHYLSKKLSKHELRINTLSGLKTSFCTHTDDIVKVDMGIPVLQVKDEITLKVQDNSIKGYYFDIGNPHFVIINNQDTYKNIEYYGPILENYHIFPNKANIETVEIIDKQTIRIRVWERGSGITLACGTGSSVSAFATYKFYNMENNIKVFLPGGDVNIEIDDDNRCYLSGKVQVVFETFIDI